MSLSPRLGLVVMLLVGLGFAASPAPDDRPLRHAPRQSPSKKDLDHREAQRLYGLGMLHERGNRLIEALRSLEEAQKFDPESASIARALFGLYVALDRTEDAFTACRKVLKMDPEDYQTAYLYARQLRGMDRSQEAKDALVLASRSPKLKARPEMAAQVWFDLALLQEQFKEWDLAEQSLRQVVAVLENPAGLIATGKFSREEVTSQITESLERLGRVCLQGKRPDAAIKAFEEAKKKDPLRGARLSYNLAQVYRDQGKPREALEQLNSYLLSQPQGVEGYEMKIGLQRKLGRGADVLPQLETSSGRDPHNVGLKLLLAREYRQARQWREAGAIYDKLLEINVTPEVYRGQFDLLKEQGTSGPVQILNKLDVVMTKAIGEEKNNGDASDARRARAMLTVLREDAELVRKLLTLAVVQVRGKTLGYATRGVLATLAMRTRQYDFAEKLFRACLDRPSGSTNLEHEAYQGLLRVLQTQHKHQEMIEICQRGLKTAQQTNRVMFHRYLVSANSALEDHKAALAAADLAVAEAGKTEALWCKRVRVDAMVQAGEHAKALAACQELLKEYNQGQDLRDARYSLSGVLHAMGKHDESEEQLQLILQADPNDATVNNDLGYHWADRNKNLPEAEQLIRKALELDRQLRTSGTSLDAESDKENAAYVDSLGWVLFRRGKLEEAREQLEKAASLPSGEEDPVVWDHLGDVYVRLKQPQKAVEVWKKSLSLYDKGARRKADGRYREIQEKVRQVTP